MPLTTILDAAERELLQLVLREPPQAIVWDINAIYFVLGDTAIKVEASAETPLPAFPDEEVMCIRTTVVSPSPRFVREGELPYWYRVMCENEPVLRMEIVRTAVRIPGEEIVAPTDPSGIITDAGVLIHTRLGIIPAVQLENNFGFHNWTASQAWASPEDVDAQLRPEYVPHELAL